jgi:hypothetical protein
LLPYWLLFGMFAAGSLEYRRASQSGPRPTPLLYVAALLTTVMIGLRYEVGGDWINYEEIYVEIAYSDLLDVIRTSDPGYAVLNWVSYQIGYGIWFVNLVCALIFCWGLTKFLRREPNPWLGGLIAVPYLIIVVAMGYTRQGVAIGLILAGLSILDRGSLLRFTFYILIAASFHKSAIVVLPLVALAANRNRIATGALLGATAILLYYLFVQDQIDRMLVNYVEAEYSSQGAAIRVAMNLPPALLFLATQRRFDFTEPQRLLWRNFALSALLALFLLVTTSSSTAVDRLALYLIPLQIVILGRIPDAFGGPSKSKMLLLVTIIAYSAAIQFVWLNYAVNASGWVPYKNYLWTPT